MSKKLFFLAGVAFAGLCASSGANAQVPPSYRPGVAVPPNAGTSSVQAPAGNLVQRRYDPNVVQGQPQFPNGYQGPATDPGRAQQGGEEIFFIDENSPAPAKLAEGISTRNEQSMMQAASQLSGDYGAVPRWSLPAGKIQDAWSRPFDSMASGQSAPGTIRFQWSADLVMPVRLREGMVTNLVFPEWESVSDVIIGDPSVLEASIVRGNQLAVKSVATGADTSLSMIGGSGNVYTFYLRTEGRNTKVITDLQVFVQAEPSKASREWFRDEIRGYGYRAASVTVEAGSKDERRNEVEASAARDENIDIAHPARSGDDPVPLDRRIFDMKMYEAKPGDSIIAPEYVYTDGRFTYFHFPPGMTDRPIVTRIVDGVEGRVNTRVAGRHSEVIIAEAVGDFVLRSGSRIVCVKKIRPGKTQEDRKPTTEMTTASQGREFVQRGGAS